MTCIVIPAAQNVLQHSTLVLHALDGDTGDAVGNGRCQQPHHVLGLVLALLAWCMVFASGKGFGRAKCQGTRTRNGL